MSQVTVSGYHGNTIYVAISSQYNFQLATQLASAMTRAAATGAVTVTQDTTTAPAGQPAELVKTVSGLTVLPGTYVDVVNTAANVIITSSSTSAINVLSGPGTFAFQGTGAGGTIVTGDGNDNIALSGSGSLGWNIAAGLGNNRIAALTTGASTISAGAGNNTIQLGGGPSFVLTTGADTIIAGAGNATVTAQPGGSDKITGGAGALNFTNADHASTVTGGTGSVTVSGGAGGGVFQGGVNGNNDLVAGTGATTLIGRSGGDTLVAGAGQDSLVMGTGAETIVFNNGQAGGIYMIADFLPNLDKLHLGGYGAGEQTHLLATQSLNAGTGTLTAGLSDGSQISFVGLGHVLTTANFG